MTQHLTKSQIDQLRVVLAAVGLDVRPMAKLKAKATDEISARIAALQAMKFKTGGVKSRLLRTLRDVQAFGPWSEAKGAYNYQSGVTGLSGYAWLTGAEIDAHWRSLGAIKPAPRYQLLTYNKRRASARERIAQGLATGSRYVLGRSFTPPKPKARRASDII